MVTADVEEALQELRRGRNVVLIVGEDFDAFGGHLQVGGEATDGRLAIMVGDPSDPSTAAAAHQMHDELFSTRR